jgi:hypothetical protein
LATTSASFILGCHAGFARMTALSCIISSSRSVRTGVTATWRPARKGSGKAAISVILSALPEMIVQRGIPRL